MKVLKLSADGYRNLKTVKFTADPGMNIIYGSNAQGKTNLIEAIWLFTGAKSFRGTKDKDQVAFEAERAVLNLDFSANERDQQAKIIIENRRRAELSGVSLPSPSALAGEFCAVIFSPAHMSLVKDGPSERRRFLDTAIGQLWPKYIDLLRRYTRAVSQRNSIFKNARTMGINRDMLELFEQTIADNGSKIIAYRIRYIDIIKNTAPVIYHGISGKQENLSIDYICKHGKDYSVASLIDALKNARKEDSFSCTTSQGPHRDDMEFKIDGISTRSFGSQGQQRSVVLSLKLSEAEVIKKTTGEQPIALLDDVMSELDTVRQEYILNHIRDWQVFITCCDPSPLSKLAHGNIFYMENGQLCPK